MKGDTALIKGYPDMPAVFFIHGLGMDKRIWESPDESRVLGGTFPINLLLNKEPRPDAKHAGAGREAVRRLFLGERAVHLTTLFHSLAGEGYTVVAWSQKRPSAGIGTTVSELREIVDTQKAHCKSGIILIGHSRGGLVARKYLSGGDARVKALVTLASPHLGSRMAQWVEYLSPVASLITPLLPDSELGTMAGAIKRILTFLGSRAVKELLPESPFFKSLKDTRAEGVYYLSVGGIDPTLFSVYLQEPEMTHKESGGVVVNRRKVFSVPGILEKIIPTSLFPDELRQGKGDGFVSAESAKLPWSDRHCDFALNHAAILFDEKVRSVVSEALNRL